MQLSCLLLLVVWLGGGWDRWGQTATVNFIAPLHDNHTHHSWPSPSSSSPAFISSLCGSSLRSTSFIETGSWSGSVEMADLVAKRGIKKSALTRRLNNLERLVSESEVDQVRVKYKEIKEAFKEFEESHLAYHDSLDDDAEIQDSDTYFDQAERIYTDTLMMVSKFLQSSQGEHPAPSKPGYVKMPPAPQPDIFTGNPEHYPMWLAAFKTLIDRHQIGYDEKMFYLKRYTGGEAQFAISALFMCPSKLSYESALEILRTRFGDSRMVTTSFRKRLENWPRIAEKDYKGLQKFADFLAQVIVAKSNYPSLKILDDDFENSKLLKKLPSSLATKWVEIVVQSSTFPTFERFAKFIKDKAEIVNHSLWDCSHNQTSDKNKISQNKSSTLKTDLDISHDNAQPKSDPPVSCVICKNNHRVTKCPVFSGMSLNERKQAIMKHRMCFGCLSVGHQCSACRSKHTCAVCKSKHPTLLHDYNRTQSNNSGNTDGHVNEDASGNFQHSGATISTCQSSTHKSVNSACYTTMVVPVLVSHPDGNNDVLVYALLDTQSNTHFVSHDVLNMLGISGQETTLDLTTMNGRKSASTQVVENLTIKGVYSEQCIKVSRCYTRDSIPCNRASIPTADNVSAWSHLSGVELPPYFDDAPIGLLIGYTCTQALRPLEVIPGRDSEPFALKTNLGWCVVGMVNGTPSEADSDSCTHYVKGCISLQITCREIMVDKPDLHDMNSEEKCSVEDIRFMNILSTEMHQRHDCYYEAPLPLKHEHKFPNNRSYALARLSGLKRRFSRDEMYHNKYTAVMQETLDLGFAERVPENESGPVGRTWYLPHQSVPSKDKLRVVYDCSATFNGTCLNELLLQGPDLLNTLLGILLRFRRESVGILCDVQKMYLQFKVTHADTDLLRFLWWPKGDISLDPVDHRMVVHLFGAASSSGVATYGLRKIADDHGNKHTQEASNFVKQDFYVDDGVTSVSSDQSAHALLTNTQKLLAEGGLSLHKFMSNSADLMKNISESDKAPETSDHMYKALGIKWDVVSDELCVPLSLKPMKPTRRCILSVVSSIFDPLGFVAPMLLQAKVILQDLCRISCAWDEILPPEVIIRIQKWYTLVQSMDEVRVPRCHKPAFEVDSVELHHFADACTSGYAACSYVRYVGAAKEFQVSFLLGKCRVIPLKPILTVPRMELLAAVLATQVAEIVKRELCVPDREYFWTDSTIVLGYIRNESTRFKVFVANRVQKIRMNSEPSQWHHVDSQCNPADDGSRGILSTRWLQGPDFLKEELDIQEETAPQLQLDDKEICHLSQSSMKPGVMKVITYRDWYTTLKVWAWVHRFIHNSAPRQDRQTGELTLDEIKKAEKSVLILVQEECFSSERIILRQGLAVPRDSALYKLDVFMADDGLLRIGGRLRHASLSYELKHPVVVPRDHILSTFIIRHYHAQVHHQGRGITVGEIRSHGYWIIGLGNQVKKLIQLCIQCRRLRAKPIDQKMADLPEDRASPSPPFTFSACDCFGPFIVKSGRKELKRYGVVFTCLVSRAVHLEVVFSLSTDSFMNSFRRFIATRGLVVVLRCDQGTNFVGAAPELLKMGCQMKFNPPAASHFGGVHERMVGSSRRIIEGILLEHGAQLDDEGLITVLAETASVINSRPLNVQNLEDPLSLEPLTANHLIMMKSKVITKPSLPSDPADLYALKRWKRVQYLVDLFWTRWRKEIVQICLSRAKWNKVRPNVKVDDIVLTVDELSHRSQWKLARVIDVKKSRDNLVRSATVILPNRSELVRPVAACLRRGELNLIISRV